MEDAAAKYEAWAEQLRKQLAANAKLRRQVRFFPLFALVTSPVGLLVAPWLTASIALAWILLWGTTLYITYMRTWEYRNELSSALAEVDRIRGAAP